MSRFHECLKSILCTYRFIPAVTFEQACLPAYREPARGVVAVPDPSPHMPDSDPLYGNTIRKLT